VSDCGKYLLGGVLVGDAAEYGTLLQMMLNRIELPESPEFLILPQSDGKAKPALGVDALPDSAQICSCNDVSKGALCAAVAGADHHRRTEKLHRRRHLLRRLRAAGDAGDEGRDEEAGHGRQQPPVRTLRLLAPGAAPPGARRPDQELRRAAGQARQGPGLRHLQAGGGQHPGVDLERLRAEAGARQPAGFERLLPRQHPEGRHLLGGAAHAGRRSDGRRPDRGRQVAKKYGLYTKITGGQRVDLFGARVDQLPLIWEELIAAGFESGHAYGKSLRTVKSCVGSTWCRYGVDDSVGFAIALENRYKGLRTPHKIKFGVSGCTRECAEAQGKDVGLIATEKGWNLYVCGNGGMKPRHAELLASDLDEATVVRYIDRFLMFYVRTADRLQRTSVWRDNLEGGLDYLKQVVVDDKLGIAAELEADMQHVVDTYACEWKNAVEIRRRAQALPPLRQQRPADANVVFMPERGQIRPATIEERKRVIPIAIKAA
jgi:nitrite reductase (NADH) large subunit